MMRDRPTGELMRLHLWLTVASVALIPVLSSHLAAQTPAPAQSPAPDPAFEASKAAFDALPEADRRAMQEALVWTGDYKGTVDGGFGRMTREAIIAYAKRAKLPADGTLDQKGRAALVAAGQKAREAAQFKAVTEAKSGVTIGIPQKLFSKVTPGQAGARYATADGAATLDVFTSPDSGNDLVAMFDKLKADSPTRKVTYRIQRPDFFVVSGDAAGKSFYTRVAKGVAKDAPVLRGYTLTYPTQQRAAFDTINIAIANSFNPFGPVQVAAAAAAGGAQPGRPAGPTPSASAVIPAKPTLVATAIAVAPGKALSVLASRTCTDPQVGGRKATLSPQAGPEGLALFDVPGLNAPALSPAAHAGGSAVVLQQAARSGNPSSELLVAPGDVTGEANAPRVFAPLQGASNGAPVFSRGGALVGLAAVPKSAPRLVAGIVPAASMPMIGAEAARAFLQTAGVASAAPAPAGGEKSAGEIAAAVRTSILPVVCTQ
jgi:peptidoglycan hydrolase-like protein with peptidoglycan-binding domain